jgi:MFS transporter, SP family, arabinose:H+ symporter
MNLLATLLGMSLIDKLGRRTLLLIGSVGMTLCLASVAAIFYTNTHLNALVWLLVAYIGFFAISQEAVIWVYMAEVFPNERDHLVQFPTLAKSSGGLPFAFFAGMMALQFLSFYSYIRRQRESPLSSSSTSSASIADAYQRPLIVISLKICDG